MQTSQNPDNNGNSNSRAGTPPRPPYSPVTPVFAQLAPIQATGEGHPIVPPPVSSSLSPTSTHPTLPQPSSHSRSQSYSHAQNKPSSAAPVPAPAPAPAPVFATEPPPPVPISESDNPDAIALRSAISILQIQKQQSLRDIQTLDRMKKAAAADPERFAQELAAGNLSAEDRGGFVNFSENRGDEEEEEEEGDDDEENVNQEKDVFSNLGKIPTPQNIVRTPSINWAKYQIVGEPLDKMHAEQLRRPSAGKPRWEESTQRAPEHVLASPYRPLVDELSPGKVKEASRKRS